MKQTRDKTAFNDVMDKILVLNASTIKIQFMCSTKQTSSSD